MALVTARHIVHVSVDLKQAEARLVSFSGFSILLASGPNPLIPAEVELSVGLLCCFRRT